MLDQLPSPWAEVKHELQRQVRYEPEGEPAKRLDLIHDNIRAQGNVTAASRLATLLRDPGDSPELVIFYGCAGGVRKEQLGEAYLVSGVSYVSLADVMPGDDAKPESPDWPTHERVRLKNKWLCEVGDADIDRPADICFPSVSPPAVHPAQAANLRSVHIVATDAVVKVSPAAKPPVESDPGRFEKGEWSYAQALAHFGAKYPDVLIEMESYGLAATAVAMGLQNRIAIIRVVTDLLSDKGEDKGKQKQAAYLLTRNRAVRSIIDYVVESL
jgi:nucleoside phosphorylase